MFCSVRGMCMYCTACRQAGVCARLQLVGVIGMNHCVLVLHYTAWLVWHLWLVSMRGPLLCPGVPYVMAYWNGCRWKWRGTNCLHFRWLDFPLINPDVLESSHCWELQKQNSFGPVPLSYSTLWWIRNRTTENSLDCSLCRFQTVIQQEVEEL